MTKALPDVDARLDLVMAGKPRLELSPADVGTLHELHAAYPQGCDIRLSPGVFSLRQVVRLTSATRVTGSGVGQTTIVLEPGSNCHMFTNVDHGRGNTGIILRDFSVVGNGDSQSRPEGHKPLTFACAVYLKTVRSAVALNIDFTDIRQTALHFSACTNVLCAGIASRRLGWSGVSTTATSHIYVQARVEDAGRDVMHSGIHMDGGRGVHVEAEVFDTTGNGIMIDSANAPLIGCSVGGRAEGCKRGLSLSGSATHALSNVGITGDFSRNRDAGVMVSNAEHVAILGARMVGNEGYGLLFQGREGGRNCVVANCQIEGNGTDIGHLHSSHTNWVFPSADRIADLFDLEPNRRATRLALGAPAPWFR